MNLIFSIYFFISYHCIISQQIRQPLKFLNKKLMSKIDTNPYFYHHTKRAQIESQKINVRKTGYCQSEGIYCKMINSKSLDDSVIDTPDLRVLKNSVEILIGGIMSSMEQHAQMKDRNIYYIQDQSRQALDDHMFYRHPFKQTIY